MGTLYTPQGGNVMQSQQNSQMMNALASITGSAPAAAFGAASQAAPNYGATPIPQLANLEEALRTMFAHDQALAANYANPNLYGGGGAPPQGNPAGAFASPLQATIESITNPQGMTTPGAITGAMGNEIGGQMDTLQNVMDAIDFNKTRTDTSYNNMLKFLSDIFGEEQANKRAAMQYNTNQEDEDMMADDYIEQIKSGMKITSVPAKDRRAVARRMAERGLSLDKINKEIEGKPIIENISDLKDLWDKIPPNTFDRGLSSKVVGFGKQAASMLGYENELSRYNKKRDFILSSLRELVKQGGNMSNKDMARIEEGLAKITDTPETAQGTWEDIFNTLSNRYGDDIVSAHWTANRSSSSQSGTVRLQDPSTGKKYEYDGTNDPDYISDLQRGFRPI